MMKVETEKKHLGKRIDRFLSDLYVDKSRSFWQKSITKGCVSINGHKVKSNYVLKEKDVIEISDLDTGRQIPKEQIKVPKINIIYEDENVIVLDKPPGIPVHDAKTYKGPTVSDFLEERFPEMKNVGEDPVRPGIVHRLDKDTSGILIAAKNNESFEFLKNQFKNREVKKTYIALVFGLIPSEQGTINYKIGRSKSDPKKQTVIDSKKKETIKSKEAITLYTVISRFKEYTLLEVSPKTGRMHQIRVHLKAIGCPVAGDKKYFTKNSRRMKPEIERQFLHASKLEINIPKKGKKVFLSKLPKDLENFIGKLSILD